MNRFRPGILEELARLGVVPKAQTRPELVREFLNDLYRLELQKLRDRVLRRELPRPALAGCVVDLRRKYRLLSVPIREWSE